MNNSVATSILGPIFKSQGYALSYSNLLSCIPMDKFELTDNIEALIHTGYLLRSIETLSNDVIFRLTSKAISEFSHLRPLSKANLLKVFKHIALTCHHSAYHNAPLSKIRPYCEHTVGVTTFDNALGKLLAASYIESQTITSTTGTFSVLTITNRGIKAYLSSTGIDLSFPKSTTRTPYIKKELTEDEKARQSSLKELSHICFAYKKLEKKIKSGNVLTSSEKQEVPKLQLEMNNLRTLLGIETIDYTANNSSSNSNSKGGDK